MLLRCTTSPESADELELRKWLVDKFGETDEETLARYVWENHKGRGVEYLQVLAAFVRETAANGTGFVRKLLDGAAKPLEQRQAEIELLAWWTPRKDAAIAKVNRYRGEDQKKAAREEYDALVRGLIWTVHQMWPDKHRATVKGAVLAAFVHDEDGGNYTFEVSRLVGALANPDPLAANARASWSAEPS